MYKFDMSKDFIFCLCMYLYVALFGKEKLAMAADTSNVTFNNVLQSTNHFSVTIYKMVSEINPDSSILISPLSLQLVMALVYTGARGETAKEIAKLLQLPNNSMFSVLEGYHDLITILKDPRLGVFTKLFLENQFAVNNDFENDAIKYFESAVQRVSFASDKNVVNVINSWVECKTNGKIKDLITSDVINSNTIMVLMSVIHFKADWQKAFPESETNKEDFYVTKDETKEIEMMSIYDEHFRYLEHPKLKSKILELPYKDRSFSMFIILPNSINGLSDLEKTLTGINLYEEFKHLELTKVDVTVPKFKLSQTIDYKDILMKFGVSVMFSEMEADFSGISKGPLTVSNIMQNTFIEVNEQGTEAAVGTGTIISVRSFEIKARFTADHPFLFLITRSPSDNKSVPLTLFIGKFNGD